jgi:hypothetical protein
MATPSAKPEQLPVETLKPPHREILIRAVANVLSSPLANQTYAQIVDGLPISHVATDCYSVALCPEHPLLDEHKELCPGVPEEAEKLCSSFDVTALLMPSTVSVEPRSEIPL